MSNLKKIGLTITKLSKWKVTSGIYRWTSPSGKSYIGQAINLKKRKREFRRPNSVYTSKGSKIDNARKKYKDFDTWEYEVLEECEIEKLDEREEYWITYYNTKEEGYNLTLGGDGNKGWVMSESQREICRESINKSHREGKFDWWYNSTRYREMVRTTSLGKKQTEEAKRKNSEAHKGKHRSKETIEKFSKSLKKKYVEGFVNINQKEAISKKVNQYDLDGNLIEVGTPM